MKQRNNPARSGLSVLSLQFQVVGDRPDWPVVQILVDGIDPFAADRPGCRGFGPEAILGAESPLLPKDLGRRVAVYTCSCGIAGCGVIAPMIVPAPNGSTVAWVDFRGYTGVFNRPVAPSVDQYEGHPWGFPAIEFDREQYVAEVKRASADRSWETSRRKTCRLLHEILKPLQLSLPPDATLRGVSPSSTQAGAILMFESGGNWSDPGNRQEMLALTSQHSDPAQAAADMAGQLTATPPSEWSKKFGWSPLRR